MEMYYRTKRPDKLPKYMKWEEIKAFFGSFKLNSYNEMYHYYFFKLMMYSGLRPIEVLKIKLEDINFQECNIFIPETKNKKQHYAVVHPDFMNDLHEWIKLMKSHYPNTPYLFPSFTHIIKDKVTPVRIYFKNQLKKAGLSTEYMPYSLRHSFATHLYNNDCPIEKISKMLNHQSVSTTLVYTYIAVRPYVEEVKKLEYI